MMHALLFPPGSTPCRITVHQQSTYCTLTDTDALLLLWTTSCVLAATDAVFLIVVPAAAFTFTVSFTGPHELPLFSTPVRVHLNVPPLPTFGCVHVPLVVLKLTKVVPAGSTSVIVSPSDTSG